MNSILSKFFLFIFLTGCFCVAALGQGTDASNGSLFGKNDDKDSPKSVKEMLLKMQIDKEKKEFQEMLDRGEEAVKLSEQVERSYETRGGLTEDDRRKIDTVEKLVKKIRGELGGSDDETAADDDASTNEKKPTDVVGGIKYLRTSTERLLEELKKTSRFTISAAAIQSSNAVLRVARFLRFGN
jgi:hypothetical protein